MKELKLSKDAFATFIKNFIVPAFAVFYSQGELCQFCEKANLQNLLDTLYKIFTIVIYRCASN